MKTLIEKIIAADTWGHRHAVLIFTALSLFGFMAFSQLFLPTLETHAEEPVLGCMDPAASNYDPLADTDDGSCIPYGCTQVRAENYDPVAVDDDGSCMLGGCTDALADNYDPNATYENGMCEYYGCTQPRAENYDPSATTDDGSCILGGCTDMVDTSNYDPNATYDNGSCIYYVRGCTDTIANNYDPSATADDGSCTYDEYGCMDPVAHNYSAAANIDDNSCVYRDLDPQTFCTAYQSLLTIPATECESLVDLYVATSGDSWVHNEGRFASENICNNRYGIACNDQSTNVVQIEMYHNNLVGTIPSSITNLSQLEHFAVPYNTLYGEIPNGLTTILPLESVVLGFNVLDIDNLSPALLQLFQDVEQNISLPFTQNATTIVYQEQADPTIMTTDLGTWCMDNAHLLTGGTALDCLALSDIYYAMNGVNRYNTDGWFTNINIAQWHGISSNGIAFNQLLNLGGINLDETGENVGHVMLTDNNLQGSLPASIQFIYGLGSLSLHNNAITALPDEIGNLFWLNTLLAGNNLLTQLPDSIGTMNLLMLSLGGDPRGIISQMIDGIFLYAFTQQGFNPGNVTMDQFFGGGAFVPSQYLNSASALFAVSGSDIQNSLQNILQGPAGLRDENYMHDGELFTSLHSSTVLNLIRVLLDIAYQNNGNHPFDQLYQIFYEYYGLDQGFSESNYNSITDLPVAFADLDDLYLLDMTQNQLEVFPEEILGLDKVMYLNISNNSLTQIPANIDAIQSLKILHIAKNNITTLPTGFQNMPNFYNLNIHGNEVADFSPLVGSNIASIHLGRGSMTQFPLALTNISTLNKLSIDGTELAQIPQEIDNLHNLYRLTVSNSLLSTATGTVPTTLTDLVFLRDLGFWGNQFVTLPSELTDTDSLLRIYLNENPLCGLSVQELDYLNAIPIAYWSESCPGGDIYGCTDGVANNYDPSATIDDGMCEYNYGCTDGASNNYDPSATMDDGTCTYDEYGCTDPVANNYNPSANIDNGMCEYNYGCTDPLANNYDATATMDDGMCTYDAGRDGDPNTRCATFEQSLDISLPECQALVDLYTTNNGINWSASAGRLDSTTVCSTDDERGQYASGRYGVYCNAQGVSNINLSNNNVLGSIPESFGNLTHLVGWDMMYNQITSLPQSLGNLDNLESLYLDGNNITTLPNSIGSLDSINFIGLARNELVSLPDTITNNITLAGIELGGNQLTALPETMGSLSNLQYLSIGAKRGNFIEVLPDSVSQLQNLQYLFMNDNFFTQLPEWFGELTQLRTVSINNNQLVSLPTNIGSLGSLQEFYASNNYIEQLPSSFVNLTSLNYLRINSNNLTDMYLEGLINIYELDISDNRIDGPIPNYITSFSNLQSFYAGRNCLSIALTDQSVITFIEGSVGSYEYIPQYVCGLKITKEASIATAYDGQVINYTISVDNNGDYPVHNITIMDLGSYILSDSYFGPTTSLVYVESSPSHDSYVDPQYNTVIGGNSDDVCFDDFINEQGIYWDALQSSLLSSAGVDVAAYGATYEFSGTNNMLAEWLIDDHCPNHYGVNSLHQCFNMLSVDTTILLNDNPNCGVSEIDFGGHYTRDIADIQSGDSVSIQVSMVVNGTGMTTGEIIENFACIQRYDGSTNCDGDYVTTAQVQYLGIASTNITEDGTEFAEQSQRVIVPNIPGVDEVIIQIDGTDYPAIYDEENNVWYVDVELPNGEYPIGVIYLDDEEIVDDTYEIVIIVNAPQPYCGDGDVNTDVEQCDDGNNINGDGCSATCQDEDEDPDPTPSPYCGDGEVDPGEQCDGGVNCNANCTFKSTGGRDRTPTVTIDYCPDGDFSPSYYDDSCGIVPIHPAADEQSDNLIDTPIDFVKRVSDVTKSMQCNIRNELVQAYVFAFDLKITTVNNICNANLEGEVTREEFAKFISSYAIAVLAKKPDPTRRCVFNDVSKTTTEMQTFARISCELGIMGLKQNGDPDTIFRPKDSVPRTEVFTALNRLVNGGIDNSETGVRYLKHMNRLVQQRVVFDTSNPQRNTLRGEILLMLMRAYKVIENMNK